MIIDTILNLFYSFWIGILHAIAGILPEATFMDLKGLDLIMQFGRQLGFVIPWNYLWTALLIIIIMEFCIFLIRTAGFVGKLIRG